MAVINTNSTAPFGAITVHRIVSFVETTFLAVRRLNAARATARQLASLSDKQLEDIGLSRGDIAATAARLTR